MKDTKSTSPFYARTLEVLKKSWLFHEFDFRTLQEMLRSFQAEAWPKDSIVMLPEQTIQTFYVLISGRVKVTRSNPRTHKELSIFVLEPGDGFDVVPLLDGMKHDVIVTAIDELEVISVPVAKIHQWMDEHPQFNKTFLPYIGKQLRALTDLASDLALHDTGTRLLKLFLRHTVESNPHASLKLIHDFSHEELANMIGTVREVVNRYLHNLRKEGIVVTHDGRVEIKDLHGLVEKIETHMAPAYPRAG